MQKETRIGLKIYKVTQEKKAAVDSVLSRYWSTFLGGIMVSAFLLCRRFVHSSVSVWNSRATVSVAYL
jgi:hypothetical protein